MRIRLLIASIIISLCQTAGAVTVLVDAAWVRAGFGAIGDRCINALLLDLKPGDRLELIIPALGESAALSPLVDFTTSRRPSVRAAELIAARRRLNQVLATADPTRWPSLAQMLTRLAAAPAPSAAKRRQRRYVIIGAPTAADPPAVDLALQRLLRGRRVVIVNLARASSERYESRLKAWRNFFAVAGAAQLHILPVSALGRNKPLALAIDCSGRPFQILDHQL